MANERNIKIFSFFSGCGFLDLGFETNGYDIVLVNEFSTSFLNAYKFAREHMGLGKPAYGYHNNDVNEFLHEKSADLGRYLNEARSDGSIVGFIGGPPCPDFSVAGKQRGRDGDNGKLSLSYIQLIIMHKPDFFLFENVKGLWKTARHREYYEELKKMLKGAGFLMTDRLTNAIEFGTPQDRDRILLFGVNNSFVKHCDVDRFPWTKHTKYNWNEIRNLNWPTQDAFVENETRTAPNNIPLELTVQYWFDKNDVEHHPNSGDCFVPRAGLEKMKRVEEGDVSKKSHKRLHRWRYSPTVAYGNNEVHLHPYKARRLTVAEAMSLQSLPKEFVLPPDMSLTDKFKTVGNGVPYLLADGIAKTIKDYFKTTTT